MRIGEPLFPRLISGQDQTSAPATPSVSFADLVAERTARDQGEALLSTAFRFEELGVFGLTHASMSGLKVQSIQPTATEEGAPDGSVETKDSVPDRDHSRDINMPRIGATTFGDPTTLAAVSSRFHRLAKGEPLIDVAVPPLEGAEGHPAYIETEGVEGADPAQRNSSKQKQASEPQTNLIVYRADSGVSLTIGGAGLLPAAQAELMRRLQSTALSLGFTVNDVVIDGVALNHPPTNRQPERTHRGH